MALVTMSMYILRCDAGATIHPDGEAKRTLGWRSRDCHRAYGPPNMRALDVLKHAEAAGWQTNTRNGTYPVQTGPHLCPACVVFNKAEDRPIRVRPYATSVYQGPS